MRVAQVLNASEGAYLLGVWLRAGLQPVFWTPPPYETAAYRPVGRLNHERVGVSDASTFTACIHTYFFYRRRYQSVRLSFWPR